MLRVRYMKLARGQARSVIPPTIPMCRKGPVACGGKGRVSAGTSLGPVPKIHTLQCQGSATAASTAGIAALPESEGQAPGETEQTARSGPATAHHPECSCSRQDCKSRRSTLPGHAEEVKGRKLITMAQSHAGGSHHHSSAHLHRPGSGYREGISGIEVTHLQGDTCTSPLLRPLYSQPCESCSYHQGS